MGEAKLRADEIEELKAKANGEDIAMRAAQAHVAQTGMVASTWVNNISVGTTVDGHMRITYGEILHQNVPPQFHGALVMPIGVAEALSGILQNVVNQFKTQMAEVAASGKPPPEPQAHIKEFGMK